MQSVIIIVLLWLIAIIATMLLVADTGAFTFLAPVYAICMIGSVVTVRKLERHAA